MSVNEELKSAGLFQRKCLIIYLTNISDQFKLRKYGDIVYFSKKMKYCVIYVNQSDLKRIAEEISHLNFVKGIEISNQDQVNLESNHIEKQITVMARQAELKLQEKDEDLFN